MKNIKAPSYQCKKCPNPNTICWCILADTNLTDKRKITNIKKEVANQFGITISDLSSKSRKKKYIKARQIAMKRCRDETGATLKEICRAFSKSHSTVLHAIRQVS